MRLAVIMPTRGRPQRALAAWDSFEKSKANYGTTVYLVLDYYDPTLPEYMKVVETHSIPYLTYEGNMVERTNGAAAYLVNRDEADVIGWAADDQRARTQGWDDAVLDAVYADGHGFVQTNDLHYGSDKAANIFIRSDIVKALGYFAPPVLSHLYVDDAWKTLGELADALVYLEDTHIEHMHPVYNKGEWDDNYREYNDPKQYVKDYEAYTAWLGDPIRQDIEKVRRCLNMPSQ
jgi:hypothetical protein